MTSSLYLENLFGSIELFEAETIVDEEINVYAVWRKGLISTIDTIGIFMIIVSA